MKTCSKCGVEKSTSEFYKHKSTADKLRPSCKSCNKVYSAGRYVENRERILEKTAEWASNNRELRSAQARARRKRPGYRDRERNLHHKWLEKNAHVVRAKVRRYQSRKKGLTPDLNKAELVGIESMYLYNQIMPGKWHVDHIKPLAEGGLHHPSNLQVLTEHDNCSKGAKWE